MVGIKKIIEILKKNPTISNKEIYRRLGDPKTLRNDVCDARRQSGIRIVKTRDAVAKLISTHSTSEIAQLLGLTEGGVKYHLKNIK